MNRVAAHPFALLTDAARAENLANSRSSQWGYGAIAFCLVHIPLALLISRVPMLSTLHALAALGVGIWWATTDPHRPMRVAYVGAYITGAEVLWRMTGSQVFWEFGKYATAFIFLLAILRSGRVKGPFLMFGYFALLLPSIVVIVATLGFEAQGYISFNLSGPFAMMMAAWFFSQVKISIDQVQRMFLIAVGPIIGIASIAFFGIKAAEKILFTHSSNFATSGGFGPNQVSAALGLGALFALMFIVLGKTDRLLKLLMLGAMLFMAAQSALTFSRGGLYNCAGGIALASIYLLRNAKTRRSLMLVAVVVFVLGSFVIYPRLDSFSGGSLGERFSNTNTTNRIQIVLDELRVWQDHPILGVGPGGSNSVGASTAHTEFARLPAEHGVLGAIALLLLLVAALRSIRKAKSVKGKAIAVCLIGWSFLYMLNAAMRLSAPAFMFGLAFATVLPESTSTLKVLLMALLRRRYWTRLRRRADAVPVLNAIS
jgi:O-antigen ligase